MKTKVFSMKELTEQQERDAIDTCAAIIKKGGIVAFPTETVYGLGGNSLDAAVSIWIYAA